MSFCRCGIGHLLPKSNFRSYDALRSFSKLAQLPNLSFQDTRILQCIRDGRLSDARHLLDEMLHKDFNRSVVVATSLLSRYSKLGYVDEARKFLFHVMPEKNIVSCNVLLSGYVKSGRLNEGWSFFNGMLERDVVSWTCMVCGFADAGRIDEAWRVFEEMPTRNVVTWNSMIVGLIKNNELDEARRCFDKMVERSIVSWNVMISGYIENGRMEEARSLFNKMESPNVVTWTTMVAGCCKVGDVEEAYHLFCKMPVKNTVSWTAMISGFSWNGRYKEALLVFFRMRGDFTVKPNKETLLSLVYASAGLGYPKLGKQMHAHIIVNCLEREDHDGRLCRSLIHMYSSVEMMGFAYHLFECSMDRCTVKTYNTMINGYIRKGELENAENLFNRIPVGDKVTWTSMINGYFSAGEVAKACHCFHSMPDIDEVTWTVMISGHVQNELFAKAAELFSVMRYNGFLPLGTTYASLIAAAGALADLELGKQFHSLITKTESKLSLLVGNSFLSMYSKCGEIWDAYTIFSNMMLRDLISWNSMIMGFSNHGCSTEALRVFEDMLESGTPPNSTTFLAILSACNHAGLVAEGKDYFSKMKIIYSIEPNLDHYISMINLLGRAGKLEEAEELVLNLPFKPNHTIWGALLGACRFSNKNSTIAIRAAKEVISLDPLNAPAHVALCNVYAASGKYFEEHKLRKEMKDKNVRKVPGVSWFSHEGKYQSFFSGDLLCHESDDTNSSSLITK